MLPYSCEKNMKQMSYSPPSSISTMKKYFYDSKLKCMANQLQVLETVVSQGHIQRRKEICPAIQSTTEKDVTHGFSSETDFTKVP